MKAWFLFLIIFYALINCEPQNNIKKKELEVLKIETQIIIDGMEDEIWKIADSVDNFIQHDPKYGFPPSERTIAKVLMDDDNIYFLIKAYASKSKLVLSKGMTDQMTGDIVSVMLDTRDDKKTAYKFAVSASGVKMDCKLLDDGRQRDYSWNGIWEAESKIYDWGYLVEIKIPFKSLMYNPNINYWKIDFDRWIPELREDIYWSSYEVNSGLRVSGFQKLLFVDSKPSKSGMNIEIYPTIVGKAKYMRNNTYNTSLEPGLNAFINPSPNFSASLTIYPDFAQIESDPFNFNISRYESYFSEARPFFTEGREYFSPAGKDRNINFYQPLEFFYSRRIGKSLTANKVVPINIGAKIFGNSGDYEYATLFCQTASEKYLIDTNLFVEPKAYFSVARVKRNFFENSNIGLLFASKYTNDYHNYVADIDGAFRGSSWQFAYQFGYSSYNNNRDFAASAGYGIITDNWVFAARSRYVGENFDVSQIGFVPWKGVSEFAIISGPIFRFENISLKQISLFGGGSVYYEKIDNYADKSFFLGSNFNFLNKYGFELNVEIAKQKDNEAKYNSYSFNSYFWLNTSTNWNFNVWGNYSKTYNFRRNYLGYLATGGFSFSYKISNSLKLGTNYRTFAEYSPNHKLDKITYNGRPYISLTPFNNFNLYLYVDNTITSLTRKIERAYIGFLLSYNYSAKSWFYLAINEGYSMNYLDQNKPLELAYRNAILKFNYLIYF